MPLDYGLLGGLAEGLKSGVEAYNQAKSQRKRDEEMAIDREAKRLGLIAEQDWKNKQYELDKQKLDQEKKFKEQELLLKGREASTKGLMDPLEREIKVAQLAKTKKELEAAKAPTQGSLNAKQYSDRMKQAESILSGVAQSKFDPTSLRTPEKITPEILKSGGRKSYDTAVRTFAMGLLRKESGAAISPSEFESVEKAYFPQPGDTPEILDQKAALRAKEIQNIEAEAVPAVNYQRQMGLIGDESTAQIAPKRLIPGVKSDAEELMALERMKNEMEKQTKRAR